VRPLTAVLDASALPEHKVVDLRAAP